MIRGANYSGEQGQEYHLRVHSIDEKAKELITSIREDKFKHLIGPDEMILEFGVGPGWNISKLRCKAKYGFDVAEHLEKELNEQGIVFIKSSENLPESFFDTIICHHVLEHTLNPADCLATIHRSLKKSGKLIVAVPFENGRRFNCTDEDDPNNHIYSWNPLSFSNLLQACSFKVESCRIRRFGYEKLSAEIAGRLFMNKKLFKLIRNLCHLIRTDYEIFAIARKNEG